MKERSFASSNNRYQFNNKQYDDETETSDFGARILDADLGVWNALDQLFAKYPYLSLLDILQNFSLFTTNKKKQRSKVIPRFQQYEGANKIVERVKEGRVKKGLIWHFQGSGKSLLMVFAAQKLRRAAELKSPTVIVLVDRTDLDTQISGTFNASDIPNVEATESIKDLQTLTWRLSSLIGALPVIPLVSNVISAKISISMSCGFFINLGETSGEIPINSPR